MVKGVNFAVGVEITANWDFKHNSVQDAQLSQRDRAAGCVVVLAKKWKTGRFYGHYRSFFNYCDIIGLKICRISWKNAK